MVDAEPPVPSLRPARSWRSPPPRELWCSPDSGVGLFVGKRGSPPLAPTPPIAERRLTANPSEYPISNAALSHDGRYLAFSDPTGFYLRQVETGETHQLVLPQGFKAQPAAWFPDGTHILATSVAGPDGTTRPVATLHCWRQSPQAQRSRRGGAVSPDGSQIVFLRGSAHSEELWLMRADGGQPRKSRAKLEIFFAPRSGRGTGSVSLTCVPHMAPGTLGVQPQIEILDLTTLDLKLERTGH